MMLLRYSRSGHVLVHEHLAHEDVDLGPLLDMGAVGKIYQGIWKGEEVAVKQCHENNVAFDPEEFRFEVAMMCVLDHPNILTCRAAHVFGPRYLLISPFKRM